ncbi:hypothetical protein KAE78_11490 [Microbacterium sp. NIBRBAC000506063]|nr:hypothetical protein KAE78_11490 [Microbacterium sp. NIBRBAC000506063]
MLRRTLLWSGVATLGLAIVGAAIGWFVAGVPGLISALCGIVLAALFLSITAITILVANRWYGDPLYVPIFFGGVLGGWLLKFILFFIVLAVLRQQDWIEPMIFFIAVVVCVFFTLIIDVVVMLKTRMPYVSDATLPDAADEAGSGTADDS